MFPLLGTLVLRLFFNKQLSYYATGFSKPEQCQQTAFERKNECVFYTGGFSFIFQINADFTP